MPDCDAVMVQVPPAIKVTVVPETVQTEDVVAESNVTASPDVAVALTVKGAEPYALPASAPKVIVCVAAVTVKLWLTGVAAE